MQRLMNWFFIIFLCLSIWDVAERKPVLIIPVNEGDVFEIFYRHSVDHQIVHELFRVDREKGIILGETYFRMFGAGMGYWKGRGKLVKKGKYTAIEDMDYVLGSFYLRVGSRSVSHTLIYKGIRANLSEYWEHKLLKFEVRGCTK